MKLFAHDDIQASCRRCHQDIPGWPDRLFLCVSVHRRNRHPAQTMPKDHNTLRINLITLCQHLHRAQGILNGLVLEV